MNKVISFIKKYDIDIILLIIIIICGATFLTLLNSFDELWNFANCYKMNIGYKIYRDLNVIITPLFFYVAQIFLLIFGNTMLSFRIYNIAIFITMFIIIYKIFINLKIVRRRSIFYTILLIFIFNGIVSAGANYNILAIIPILLNILLILRNKEKNTISGILLLITFLVKQNIFIYYAIGIFIYKFITKKNIKNFILELSTIYFVTLIGITGFLIYLYIDNNLYNFINYCVLGILEFKEKNIGIEPFGIRFTYISIIIAIFNIIIANNKRINKNINKEVIMKSKMLLSFGIPLLLIQYPIFNYYHATLASAITLISFIYVIDSILIKNLDIERKKEKTLYIILVIMYLLYFIYVSCCFNELIKNGKISIMKQDAYIGIPAQNTDVNDIEEVSKYIKQQENNKNVIILSYKANLYNINLNKNNGIFDLYFLGNLGKDGEKGLINQISLLKNTIILTEKTDDNFIRQEATNARKYVIESWNKVGEIQGYCIYEK